MRSRAFNVPTAADGAIPPTEWYPSLTAASLHSRRPDDRARHWLQVEGSLTRALQLRCQQRFHVDVLAEGYGRPTREEALTLGVPLRQRVWIREVQLCGDNQPWVLARTVIPRSTLVGKARRLRHLGNRPLGAFLFSQPEWQRGAFQVGLCARNDIKREPAVARRSRFHCGEHELLVGEYFLPALLRQPVAAT